MRWLAALLVLLALQFVPGSPVIAEAAARCTSTSDNVCDTIEQAHALASSWVAGPSWWSARCAGTYTGMRVDHIPASKKFEVYAVGSGGCGGQRIYGDALYESATCAVGTWHEPTLSCFDAGVCLAHNSEPGFFGVGETTRNFRSACVGGCDFRVQPGASIVSVGGVEAVSGVFEFTGDPCESEQAPVEEEQAKNPAPQECVPVGNDATGRAYTVCMKPDGRHCYSGAPERQICWRPGETGEKADGPVLQKREVGGTPTPPSSSPPAGTTLDPTGIPMTATTTVGGNTFITTTNNYTTGGPEVDPSQPPAGEPDDGSGSPGEGEGDEGSVTGGVNCDDPPIVQGDPILANIVLQTWGTRCATESADKVSTTGDLYDCSSSWSVSGPEGSAHVVRLQAMREEICRRDADGDGQPDWTQGDAPPLQNEGEPGDGNEPAPPAGLTIGSDLLDMDGFLGVSTCPTLGVLDFGVFGSFDLDSEPVWCDLVAIMRAIVLMMAAFTAINILLGRE